jgi:hypothetical protein
MVCGGDYVHVIVYEHYYGKVPNGKEVGHKCDVGLCVNPEHLEAITRQKNIQDAFTRHRFQRAKYDEPDLIALRNGTLKVKEFAARFGVSVKHTYNIKLGHKVKWRG